MRDCSEPREYPVELRKGNPSPLLHTKEKACGFVAVGFFFNVDLEKSTL